MKKHIDKNFLLLTIISSSISAFGQADALKIGDLNIQPLLHSSMHLSWKDQDILVDPYKSEAYYSKLASPELIVITDIHGDHLNFDALKTINTKNTRIIAPKAVADRLVENGFENIQIINNGDQDVVNGITFEAIPMYNLPEDETARHTKGRGNGYILTFGKQRVYISGDTEDIPEMRQLKNIDIAFVCMNLPYTMDVNSAASAVLDFKPAMVFPFHYRGGGGKFSDVTMFKELVVDGNDQIEVRLVDWYKQ